MSSYGEGASEGEINDSINHMRDYLAQSIGYIAIGSAMAFLYSIAVMELIQVTSSLTSTVLGTAKHVTMTMAAALLVDHVIADGTPMQVAFVITGLLGYLPFTALYSYLMLTDQAYEPWSSTWRVAHSFWFGAMPEGCCARAKGEDSGGLLEERLSKLQP